MADQRVNLLHNLLVLNVSGSGHLGIAGVFVYSASPNYGRVLPYNTPIPRPQPDRPLL